MEKFIKGQVIVIPFPFSDLSGSKLRPALILTKLKGDDLICCQITSQLYKDDYCISLIPKHFISGQLPIESNIRPNRIFTVDSKIVIRSSGLVNSEKLIEVINSFVKILNE